MLIDSLVGAMNSEIWLFGLLGERFAIEIHMEFIKLQSIKYVQGCFKNLARPLQLMVVRLKLPS